MDGLGDKKSSKRKGGTKMLCVSFPGGFPAAAAGTRRRPQKYSTATWCENGSFTVFILFYLSQADAIYNMVGYPEFIMNATKLDKVFNDVSKRGSE